MSKTLSFIDTVIPLIKEIRDKEMKNIVKAANIIADSLGKGGVLHLFGMGHSLGVVNETHRRKGGLMPTSMIVDPAQLQYVRTAYFELQEGYAKPLIAQYDIREGEPLIICSNSGINPLPVEIAVETKKKGAKIIAITSMKDTLSHESNLSSGKKLYQVAHVVIDNHVPPDDLLLNIEGLSSKAVAPSGLLGIAIVQELVTQTIKIMIEKGYKPPMRIDVYSKNTKEWERKMKDKYKHRTWKLTGHPLVTNQAPPHDRVGPQKK